MGLSWTHILKYVVTTVIIMDSSCASNFRTPVIVDPVVTLLKFESILYHSIGNILFWFYPLVQNLDTTF